MAEHTFGPNCEECEGYCLRRTRDVAGILRYLTPQQMAEEIVRLDAVIAGSAPNIRMGRLPDPPTGTPSDARGAWTCSRCGFRGFWSGGPHECASGAAGVAGTPKENNDAP